MSAPLADHGDVEAALAPWLEEATGHRVVTDLPGDLEAHLPLHQISKTDGAEKAAGFDYAEVEIETYGSDREEAVTAAERARNYMSHSLVGELTTTMRVTRVKVDQTPTVVMYENPSLRRVIHIYGLWIKHTV